ncbi:mitochondrial phosphate carrier protein [Ectocarpus siliculosus]|uniref:Mitochondrial phosphate carrier protein n=1 Tax=Ectocarpus siliculosus TaxID=2880 RepID=D7FP14_ECTSI|nr:mitochondrial phosphate carrier protein [Ectocarpus siliculosus]|eukprot:CBJ30281.1 mitochondrial phosphate carrier protein [Ectocarpus siliculosus]
MTRQQAPRPGRAIVLLSVAGLGGLCASSVAPASDGSGIASHGSGGGANDAVRRQDTWSQERALHSSRGSRRRPRPAPVQTGDAQQQRAEESEVRLGSGLGRKGMFNSFSLGEHEPSSYYNTSPIPGGGVQLQQQQQDSNALTGGAAAGYNPTCYNDESSGSREFFNDDNSEEPLEEQQQQHQQAPYYGSMAPAASGGGRASHYYPGRGRNAAENLAAQQFQGYSAGRSSSSSYRHEPFFFNGENPYSGSGSSSSSSRSNGNRRRRARGGGVVAASAFPAISPALAATAAAAAAAAAYFVAGGICAAISHTAAVPLDVIKTRIQCAPPGVEYRGTWDALVRIIRSEGARVLFCGAGATLVGYALQGSLKFGFFEFLKPVFSGLFARGSRGAAAAVGAVTAPPVLGTLIAASVTAEIVGSSALTPLEAARIRMVADADYAPGLRSGIARMVSEEGVAALTRGLPAVLAKQIPYTVTKLVTFDYLVRTVASLVSRNSSGGGKKGFGTGVGGTVACAVIAGVLSSLASQPGDSLLSALNSEGRNAEVEGGGMNTVAGFDEVMMSDVNSEDGSGSMSDSGGSGSGSEEQQNGGGAYYQYSADAPVYFEGSDAPTGQLEQQQQQQQQVEPVILAMARIAREAGFSGLFRGTGARMMHVTSIVTVQLLIYQSIKNMVGIAS